MRSNDGLWRRLLRRPAVTVWRAFYLARAIVAISPAYQSLQARYLLSGAAPPATVRASLLAHVYYIDLWPEIVAIWRTLPSGSPLLVTTPLGMGEAIRKLAGSDPLIEIYESENRGRDIAPFLTLLASGRLDRFDAVLKIHTKKSPHLRLGNIRRRHLYAALAGNLGNVRRVIRLFGDARTGIVGPASWFRTYHAYWMGNRTTVEDLCRRMTPPAPVQLGFFEGSMFWVRPRALQPMRSLGLGPRNFEAEAGQLDGALHHSVERAFTLAALAAGYDTRTNSGRILLRADPAQHLALR